MSDEQLSKWVDDFMNDNKRNPAQGQAIKLMQDQKIRIAELEAELAEVREVVEKLPKTADGVVAVPGTRLYPLYPVLPEDGHPDFEDAARLEMCITDPLSGEFIREYDGLLIDTCYSTREAAEAALASRAEGGAK